MSKASPALRTRIIGLSKSCMMTQAAATPTAIQVTNTQV